MKHLSVLPTVLLLCFLALIIPNVVCATSTKQQPKSPTPNTAYSPSSLQSADLQAKREQLEQRIKKMASEGSCEKPKPVEENCTDFKQDCKRRIIAANSILQSEVNNRMIYESKWEKTCQAWKHEVQVLKNKTIQQELELKQNSLKMQQMADQIALLTSQLKFRQNICPSCPACKICPDCTSTDAISPENQNCPDCENECQVCEVCQQCPHCNDEQYHQLQQEYTALYRKFQECEEIVAQFKQSHGGSQCGHIDGQVKHFLGEGLEGLKKKMEGGLSVSQNLKDTVKKATESLAKSQSVDQSIAIIPLLINGLTKEIQSGSGPLQNDKNIGSDEKSKALNDCMSLFKKAVAKLKDCEDKLSPFIAQSNK